MAHPEINALLFCDSKHAEGEKCNMCAAPARHKVGEEIFSDDPAPARHEFTAYLCCGCFSRVMGPILPPLKLSRDSALLGATDTLCDELGKLSPYDVARVLDEVTGNIASWPESFILVWNAIAEVISRARDTQVKP